MQLLLSEEEHRLLVRLLESEIRDLRSAVHHAETHDIKASLRDDEELARRLLDRVRRPVEAMAPA